MWMGIVLQSPIMSNTLPHNPPGTGFVGMVLFLASLTMLFIAGLLGYALIRINGPLSPPWGAFHPPTLLWISTVAVILSSGTIQYSLASVRREKQQRFRDGMTATLVLGVLFLAIQTPAMIDLFRTHQELLKERVQLYGMILVLILLHAAHVLGGLIPMVVVWRNALAGKYDHEHYQPVRYMVMYWHFLDVVWIVMFATLLLLA